MYLLGVDRNITLNICSPDYAPLNEYWGHMRGPRAFKLYRGQRSGGSISLVCKGVLHSFANCLPRIDYALCAYVLLTGEYT